MSWVKSEVYVYLIPCAHNVFVRETVAIIVRAYSVAWGQSLILLPPHETSLVPKCKLYNSVGSRVRILAAILQEVIYAIVIRTRCFAHGGISHRCASWQPSDHASHQHEQPFITSQTLNVVL